MEKTSQANFIRDIIDEHNSTGRFGARVHTRFPPEPNGYLHIGHAKAICISFGIARDYKGLCNLRMDDTNPEKEEQEYVDSIIEDVRWLGFDWQDRLFYASDYFDKIYGYAIQLIKDGKAYVCDLDGDAISKYRGTVKTPGKHSPGRDRTVEENLELFERMRKGEFADGTRTLRAKIDMASPHMIMRDPVIYRIKHDDHHRTLDKWRIYPMYDFAHCISDSIEGITHSICTLEFENNRPLYDWILDNLGAYHPQQIEFARLNLSHTVLSKRKLLQLVQEKLVEGWDDPRMPTLSGFRRRGYTPLAIRNFCDDISVSKMDSIIELAVLENSIREELNKTAPRAMAVLLRPVKIVITNYPEGKTEELDAINNPEDPSAGTRKVAFGRELFIERDDFREIPPPKFFRLSPGREVRLRYAYFVKCDEVIKDLNGDITEIRCTYDPATKGGDAPDGRKVKATIHWVSASQAEKCEVRLYDTLFTKREPDDVAEGSDFRANLNPRPLAILSDCMLERSLGKAEPGSRYQFERIGYFYLDPKAAKEGKRVFNRIVTLKDEWAKIESKKELKK